MAAFLSGLILFTAFPPLEWAPAAWVAFVPLLLVIPQLSSGQAFRAGLIAGVTFWWSSICWLTRVSWPGWLMLGVYCGLFTALFAMLAAGVLRRVVAGGRLAKLAALIVIPAGWAGLEYLRSTLFTGFPWNPLGNSQAGVLPLIQCAEWGGVYAVSFFLIMFNVGVALALLAGGAVGAEGILNCGVGSMSRQSAAHRAAATEEQSPRSQRARWVDSPSAFLVRALWPLLASLVVLAAAWSAGAAAVYRLSSGPPGASVRLALVQLNIPQFEKFAVECADAIEVRLRRITVSVINRHRPDLVIWPETAVPSFVRGVPSTQQLIGDLLKQGVPLLVGTMDFDGDVERRRYFNSSFLFDPKLDAIQYYHKRHLVCFGEYVPLGDVIPFIRRLTPIPESFTPGLVQTVFRPAASPLAFAVLICFEDTVAELARDAVRAGARLLVNQTNDAWFDPSWASRQHMLHCVFRCVENRVPAVRSTNTGITCFIDRLGRVTASLPRTRGFDQMPECLVQAIGLPGPEMPLTFHAKYGDLFAQCCVILILLALGVGALQALLARRR